jgi:hypothetical protein
MPLLIILRPISRGFFLFSPLPKAVSTKLQQIAGLARQALNTVLTTLAHNIYAEFLRGRIVSPARAELLVWIGKLLQLIWKTLGRILIRFETF